LIKTFFQFGRGEHGAARSALAHVKNERGAELLRDVLGPFPFRPVRIHGSWLTWDRGIVPAIAKEVSKKRDFERLPILADALIDAGCTNDELLQHCRSKGSHVLGCWALDVVLCREGETKHRMRAASKNFNAGNSAYHD
jgi:hypothetical protein